MVHMNTVSKTKKTDSIIKYIGKMFAILDYFSMSMYVRGHVNTLSHGKSRDQNYI